MIYTLKENTNIEKKSKLVLYVYILDKDGNELVTKQEALEKGVKVRFRTEEETREIVPDNEKRYTGVKYDFPITIDENTVIEKDTDNSDLDIIRMIARKSGIKYDIQSVIDYIYYAYNHNRKKNIIGDNITSYGVTLSTINKSTSSNPPLYIKQDTDKDLIKGEQNTHTIGFGEEDILLEFGLFERAPEFYVNGISYSVFLEDRDKQVLSDDGDIIEVSKMGDPKKIQELSSIDSLRGVGHYPAQDGDDLYLMFENDIAYKKVVNSKVSFMSYGKEYMLNHPNIKTTINKEVSINTDYDPKLQQTEGYTLLFGTPDSSLVPANYSKTVFNITKIDDYSVLFRLGTGQLGKFDLRNNKLTTLDISLSTRNFDFTYIGNNEVLVYQHQPVSNSIIINKVDFSDLSNINITPMSDTPLGDILPDYVFAPSVRYLQSSNTNNRYLILFSDYSGDKCSITIIDIDTYSSKKIYFSNTLFPSNDICVHDQDVYIGCASRRSDGDSVLYHLTMDDIENALSVNQESFLETKIVGTFPYNMVDFSTYGGIFVVEIESRKYLLANYYNTSQKIAIIELEEYTNKQLKYINLHPNDENLYYRNNMCDINVDEDDNLIMHLYNEDNSSSDVYRVKLNKYDLLLSDTTDIIRCDDAEVVSEGTTGDLPQINGKLPSMAFCGNGYFFHGFYDHVAHLFRIRMNNMGYIDKKPSFTVKEFMWGSTPKKIELFETTDNNIIKIDGEIWTVLPSHFDLLSVHAVKQYIIIFVERGVRFTDRTLYCKSMFDSDVNTLGSELISRLPFRFTYSIEFFNDLVNGTRVTGYYSYLGEDGLFKMSELAFTASNGILQYTENNTKMVGVPIYNINLYKSGLITRIYYTNLKTTNNQLEFYNSANNFETPLHIIDRSRFTPFLGGGLLYFSDLCVIDDNMFFIKVYRDNDFEITSHLFRIHYYNNEYYIDYGGELGKLNDFSFDVDNNNPFSTIEYVMNKTRINTYGGTSKLITTDTANTSENQINETTFDMTDQVKYDYDIIRNNYFGLYKSNKPKSIIVDRYVVHIGADGYLRRGAYGDNDKMIFTYTTVNEISEYTVNKCLFRSSSNNRIYVYNNISWGYPNTYSSVPNVSNMPATEGRFFYLDNFLFCKKIGYTGTTIYDLRELDKSYYIEDFIIESLIGDRELYTELYALFTKENDESGNVYALNLDKLDTYDEIVPQEIRLHNIQEIEHKLLGYYSYIPEEYDVFAVNDDNSEEDIRKGVIVFGNKKDGSIYMMPVNKVMRYYLEGVTGGMNLYIEDPTIPGSKMPLSEYTGNNARTDKELLNYVGFSTNEIVSQMIIKNDCRVVIHEIKDEDVEYFSPEYRKIDDGNILIESEFYDSFIGDTLDHLVRIAFKKDIVNQKTGFEMGKHATPEFKNSETKDIYFLEQLTESMLYESYDDISFINRFVDVYIPKKLTCKRLYLRDVRIVPTVSSSAGALSINTSEECFIMNSFIKNDSGKPLDLIVKSGELITLKKLRINDSTHISLFFDTDKLNDFDKSSVKINDLSYIIETDVDRKIPYIEIGGFKDVKITKLNIISDKETIPNSNTILNINNTSDVLLMDYHNETPKKKSSDIVFDNCFDVVVDGVDIKDSDNPLYTFITTDPNVYNFTVKNGKLLNTKLVKLRGNKLNMLKLKKCELKNVELFNFLGGFKLVNFDLQNTNINNEDDIIVNATNMEMSHSSLISNGDITLNISKELYTDNDSLMDAIGNISINLGRLSSISITDALITGKTLSIKGTSEEKVRIRNSRLLLDKEFVVDNVEELKLGDSRLENIRKINILNTQVLKNNFKVINDSSVELYIDTQRMNRQLVDMDVSGITDITFNGINRGFVTLAFKNDKGTEYRNIHLKDCLIGITVDTNKSKIKVDSENSLSSYVDTLYDENTFIKSNDSKDRILTTEEKTKEEWKREYPKFLKGLDKIPYVYIGRKHK